MSAQDDVEDIISKMKALSEKYRAEADKLIAQASSDLSAITTPPSEALKYLPKSVEYIYSRSPDDLDIQEIPRFTPPPTGTLQTINQDFPEFTGTKPNITIPTIRPLVLNDPPEFTAEAPTLDALTIQPDAPSLTIPVAPDIQQPGTVQAEPISGEAPEIPLPVFDEFAGDVFTEYQTGLALMQEGLRPWSEWLATVRDQFAPVEATLITRVQQLLAGNETGLTNTWEENAYQQLRQEAALARYEGYDQLDSAPSSVTELPTGEQQYAQLKIELKTLQATLQAAADTTNERQEREVAHLTWAVNLIGGIISAALEIKAQEAMWRMQGVLLALEGAKEALDLATQLLDLKQQEIEFLVRYNDTQIRRMEAQIEIEKTKLQSLTLEVESNKLKANYNEQQSEIYEVASQYIENGIDLFKSKIELLQVDAEWKKAQLGVFSAEVAAHRAKAQAKEAEYRALRAKIDGDLVAVDAELAKVRLYEAELNAQEAAVRGLAAKAQAQAAQNTGLLEQHNARLRADTEYLELQSSTIRDAVAAISQRLSFEVKEDELAISEAELAGQKELTTAADDLQYQNLKLSKTLKEHLIRLNQLSTQSSTINSGAATLSDIAATAFSGMNGVAITQFVESM
jgi:hypothetical protein